MLTFDPEIRRRNDGENKEEKNKQERLPVVGRHAFDAKEDGSQQLALRRAEAVANHEGDATVVTRCWGKKDQVFKSQNTVVPFK